MSTVWQKFRYCWHEFRMRQKHGAEVRPERIAQEARELCHLATLAARSMEVGEQGAQDLAQLVRSMQQLERLSGTAEFDRLPVERRLALHTHLCLAREKLLTSLQTAGLATEKKQ